MQIEKVLTEIVQQAIVEDCALNDITSDLIINPNNEIFFTIKPREDIILCGVGAIKTCFFLLKKSPKFRHAKLELKVFTPDGKSIKPGESIAEGQGNAKLIFAAERIILNLIQHLSGISTLTWQFTQAVKNTNTKILDTRKTLPIFRLLQKYAVFTGGGKNHRFSLSDMILIKDNHIAAVGGISQIMKIKNQKLKIEIECEKINQVKDAIKLNPDIIMLDNMNITQIKKAQKIIQQNSNQKIKIEVSGGINLDNIKNFANLNVDYISIGSLTNSARAVDIGLDIE